MTAEGSPETLAQIAKNAADPKVPDACPLVQSGILVPLVVNILDDTLASVECEAAEPSNPVCAGCDLSSGNFIVCIRVN